MGTRPPRPAAIATAVAFALSVFCFTLFVWVSFGGNIPFKAEGYRFHVLFGSEASQLSSGADVRIAGVPVGKVVKVDPRGQTIDATVQLKSRYAPIAKDTRAIVRSKTLLGETFIELTPGGPHAAKLAEGGTLARSNVQTAQQLDRVLQSFDAPTRRALQKFLAGVATSLEGRGDAINAAIGNAGPTVEQLQRTVDVLDAQRPALQGMIRDGGTVLRAVGARRAALSDLVSAGNQVFSATAARNRQLTDTVRALPGFLGELRSTLSALDTTAAEAGPTLRTLRPVAPLLAPALRSTQSLAPRLRRVLRDIGPVITTSKSGLPATTKIVDAARPLVDQLYPAGKQLVPVVDFLDQYKQELVNTLANTGNASQASTPRSGGKPPLHYLRLAIPFTVEGILGVEQRAPYSRYNPYLAPGAIRDLPALKSFTCSQTKNPVVLPGTNAPCLQAQPWTFRGQTRMYPHVEADSK